MIELIYLSLNQIAVIDDEDFEIVNSYNWFAVKQPNYKETRYVARCNYTKSNGVYSMMSMHRMILNAPKGVNVDHEDGDTLNNRRYNIRLATHSQNGCNRLANSNNTTGYKGVTRKRNKFQAQIEANRVHYNLGVFNTPEEAHEAYKKAADELHKEFARY